MLLIILKRFLFIIMEEFIKPIKNYQILVLYILIFLLEYLNLIVLNLIIIFQHLHLLN